jgi:hypothetical protein
VDPGLGEELLHGVPDAGRGAGAVDQQQRRIAARASLEVLELAITGLNVVVLDGRHKHLRSSLSGRRA